MKIIATKKIDKVLILFGAFGEGHQQAAWAVHEAMQLQSPKVESVIFDFTELAYSYFSPISHYVYIKGINKFPSLYNFFYQKTRKVNSFSLKLNSLLSSGMGRIQKLLEEVQPSVVVSTFPFAAGTMSKLKQYGLTTIPAVTIITDYTDHSYWIHPCTDRYIVGSNMLRQALNLQGVANSKISDAGIPIRPKFYHSYSKRELAVKYGLNADLPTLLVMGGGYGIIGDRLATFRALNALPESLQLIIVCGRNEKLLGQARKEFEQSKHHVFLTGFIDYVQELMAVSDLILTKPGGITTSEAMAMGLPLLLYKPVLGQERDNAQFLVQSGVAVLADNLDDLSAKLLKLLSAPGLLSNMKENSKRFLMKESTVEIIDSIMQMRHQKPEQIISYSGAI